MATFDREIIESVTAACQAGLAAASESLQRALGAQVALEWQDSSEFSLGALPDECRGPGLIVVLRVGHEAALVVLPESAGILPAWCVSPDETDQEKLDTLAMELGGLFLPETHPATAAQAGYVGDLEHGLRQAAIGAAAARATLTMRGEYGSGVLSVIWPASQPAAVFTVPADPVPANIESGANQEDATALPGLEPGEQPQAVGGAASNSGDPAGRPAGHVAPPPGSARRRKVHCEEVEEGIPQLPPYSRSLLKIQVPVIVTLAESKQPIKNVLEMGPGSIIHFNKPCEDTLALEIAGQKVALGEAVKVGDKFGLWVTSMILPEERFWVISNRAQTERVK